MSEKIAKLGIERDNDLMYYIKNGAVWATPRKKPGQPKGEPEMIEDPGVEMDYSKYIYFLDGDGDIARKERASGGGRRKKKINGVTSPKKKTNGATPRTKKRSAKPRKTPRSSISGHYVTEATAARHPRTTVKETAPARGGKKSEAQLDAEIKECLAKAGMPDVTPESAPAGARMRRHRY